MYFSFLLDENRAVLYYLHMYIHLYKKGEMKMRTKEMVVGGLLIALAVIIPVAFGGVLSIKIPPFTATLAAHVPVMLAMLVGPQIAALTGLGSAIGFMVALGMPVVGARAATHIIFGLLGGVLIKRGMSFRNALIVTAPLHALMEALIVIPFGFTLYNAGVVVGVGTLLHHAADSAIAVAVAAVLGQRIFAVSARK